MLFRGGSRADATSKIECFVIIVNGFPSLTIITKHSILDVAAALDPPLIHSDIFLLYTKVRVSHSLYKSDNNSKPCILKNLLLAVRKKNN